jgi:hypothetical protein
MIRYWDDAPQESRLLTPRAAASYAFQLNGRAGIARKGIGMSVKRGFAACQRAQ